MNIEGAEYIIERWVNVYNGMKGIYEESFREQMKLADENERLKYKLETAELELQGVARERDILRMVAKRWEARVENISSRETLTEKLNKMSDKREALQEVVDELRAQNEREGTRVHELRIERDAGREIIKEYMEVLSELECKLRNAQEEVDDLQAQIEREDEKKRLLEDES